MLERATHFWSSGRNLSQAAPRESFEGIVFRENYDRAIYAVRRSSGKFTS
jgi:hypothetical protein